MWVGHPCQLNLLGPINPPEQRLPLGPKTGTLNGEPLAIRLSYPTPTSYRNSN